jgi:hypothetical protein
MDDKDIQLRNILRLKRIERPSDAEWKKFKVDFENRRLSAMKESKFKRVITSFRSLNFKEMVGASAAFLALALVLLPINRGSHDLPKLGSTRVMKPVNQNHVVFINDKMTGSADRQIFVADVCPSSFLNGNVRYVNDSLLAANYICM